MSNRLFVGNISWGTDDASLERAFGQYGQVVKAHVLRDRETGRSRGFGFVELGSAEEAQKAIEALNDSDLDGRQIRVTEANPPKQR